MCWLCCNLTSFIQVTHTCVWMAQPRAKTEGSCCRYSMQRTRLILSSCLAPELVVWVWIYKQLTPWLYLTVTGTRIRLVKIPSKIAYKLLVVFESLLMYFVVFSRAALYCVRAPNISPRASCALACARGYVTRLESRACAFILPVILALCEVYINLPRRYLAKRQLLIGKMLITWPHEISGCFEFLSLKENSINFICALRWLEVNLLNCSFSLPRVVLTLWKQRTCQAQERSKWRFISENLDLPLAF